MVAKGGYCFARPQTGSSIPIAAPHLPCALANDIMHMGNIHAFIGGNMSDSENHASRRELKHLPANSIGCRMDVLMGAARCQDKVVSKFT